MAITITMGIQKGGCGKSTTTGILSHLMQEDGYRVLAVDMDSQGNLTELLSGQPANEFMGKSVLEAMQQRDIKSYIVPVNDHLDLLPANNFLATMPRWIYTGRTYQGETIPAGEKPILVLDQALEQVRDQYDFIVIDTPPSLSEQTTNALCASEYVVVMFECSNWSYSAIPNFMDSVTSANELGNRGTQVLGILRTMNDVRRSDAKAFNELIAEDYPDEVFETIITRKAPIGRLSLYGFNENTELKQALEQYRNFYKELIQRVKGE
ncbi:ParA family protein [Bacillus badius]|uniref:ParA-like membrane-associated ATPase n=1 Tax=Bacillus badius TaxID=1455 RepID=A0ABR5ARX5_BACBA|nr:ParA family protein [Bacillus badius]KIL74098.1 ParA-like membrane-associated ATPase [Bacillus badius]KIL77513.1 ParA-like membrane-associated ATPase [Bacillus badius]KZN99306.1 cobyrinic acid a,c-diamide synthase [Bacillus badius]KZR58559.1 cobyrinic acid a,c-diamide synthase [Bacillus badius]MED0668525.1 ParA family protein [Bacillus badius]